MNTTQTQFLNKNGILTPKQVRQERFIEWMKKVKNVYSCQPERMAAAMEMVE